jgi:hypothetical protein
MSKAELRCACCPETQMPEGYSEEPIETLSPEELVWNDEKHLQLGRPSEVKTLDGDFGYDGRFVKMLPSNFGFTSPFRILSEEGSRVLDHVLPAMDKYAKSSSRIPRMVRGATFRSEFLNRMAHSTEILRLVSNLAGCEVIFHPMKIHQLHIDLIPTSTMKPVDRWHCDTTPFVLIIFCTDPNAYMGGELQYFDGTREEGTALLASNGDLPTDRVVSVGRQEKGYGVLLQGWRVFHRESPVLFGDSRTTIAYSFYPRNVLSLEACTHLSQTYDPVDPLHVILSDWVRFRAWKVMRRMEMLQEELFPDRVLKCYSPVPSEAEMFEIINICYNKLFNIVRTLPYTRDRDHCAEMLKDAVSDLVTYLSLTYPDLMITEKYGVERKRSGSSDEPPKPSMTSVADMSTFSEDSSDPNSVNHKSPVHSVDFLAHKCGLFNLLAAVEDIDNCIQDIVTLQEQESKLIYF